MPERIFKCQHVACNVKSWYHRFVVKIFPVNKFNNVIKCDFNISSVTSTLLSSLAAF